MKINKILFTIFIITTIVHLIYATIVNRGLFGDGAIYSLVMLQEDNIFIDQSHSRFHITFLLQAPAFILYQFTKLKSVLTHTFSLTLFLIPYIFLLISLYVGKRTKNEDLFWFNFGFFSIFSLPASIFSVTETITGNIILGILYQYIWSKKEFSKLDLLLITTLLFLSFGIYEYIIIIAPIFIFCIMFISKNDSKKLKIIKFGISFILCISAIKSFCLLFSENGSYEEINRFLNEFINVITFFYNSNILISFLALIFVLFTFLSKKQIPIYILFLINLCIFCKLFLNLEETLLPEFEQNARTLNILFFPIFLIFISIYKYKKENLLTDKKLLQFKTIIILCAIFQNIWQIINSFYWSENIMFIEKEVKSSNTCLYKNKNDKLYLGNSREKKHLRRYVYPMLYTITYILMTDDYKIKSIPMSYDITIDKKDKEKIIVLDELIIPYEKNIKVLFTYKIDKKNEIWDLSEIK